MEESFWIKQRTVWKLKWKFHCTYPIFVVLFYVLKFDGIENQFFIKVQNQPNKSENIVVECRQQNKKIESFLNFTTWPKRIMAIISISMFFRSFLFVAPFFAPLCTVWYTTRTTCIQSRLINVCCFKPHHEQQSMHTNKQTHTRGQCINELWQQIPNKLLHSKQTN